MATKHLEYDGYKFDVDMDMFDDVRFYEIADELESKPSLNIEIAKMGLGKDGFNKFSEHFTKRDGRLKMSVVMGVVAKIFTESDPKD